MTLIDYASVLTRVEPNLQFGHLERRRLPDLVRARLRPARHRRRSVALALRAHDPLRLLHRPRPLRPRSAQSQRPSHLRTRRSFRPPRPHLSTADYDHEHHLQYHDHHHQYYHHQYHDHQYHDNEYTYHKYGCSIQDIHAGFRPCPPPLPSSSRHADDRYISIVNLAFASPSLSSWLKLRLRKGVSVTFDADPSCSSHNGSGLRRAGLSERGRVHDI